MKEESNVTENDYESFSKLLENYDYRRPKRGQVLDGRILSINEDAILIDVGLKRDAVVPAKELSQIDTDFLQNLAVGDQMPVYVIRPGRGNEDLLVSLQRAVESKNWEEAQACLEDGTSLELNVTEQNRGGLLVRYEQIEGFVPNSHIPGIQRDMGLGQIQVIKSGWIGKKIAVKAIEVDLQRHKLVFSALAAQDEKRKQRLLELKLMQNEVITGKISSVVDFGVFIDLDGVDGLVHVSELDWVRVENPKDLFTPGNEMQVEILDVDIERGRITLSRKSQLPNPWAGLVDRYQPGDVIECEVAQIMDFGAFVRLPEGVQGLIPKNEMGYTHTETPQETIKKGDMVLTKVLSLEAEEGRMALSMRQVPREKQIDWLLDNGTDS